MIRDLYSDTKNHKPLMWDNPTYNNPSQPVIGVSIYEAFAYCRWLSMKTGRCFRLLTSEEWEAAAYSNQKAYAYGNRPSPLFANTNESGLNRIAPVGIFPQNRTKDGVFDLTGNIFEWTSTIYGMPFNDMFIQYTCKGGSWIQNIERSKSTYNGRGMGWVRNLDLGFRVCLDEN